MSVVPIPLESFFPFNQGQGLNATQARWRLMARLWYGSGVVPGYLSQLNSSLAAGFLTIQPGGVWIDGFYGETTVAMRISVPGNGTVVARMDPSAGQVVFAFVPSPTAPLQDPKNIFEIPLYSIVGTTLTDIRQFANATPGKAAGGRVYRTAAYTTVGVTSYVDYAWDSPTPRPPGFSSTGIFTCPYAADYLCIAQGGFNASAAQQYYNITLMHNGVTTVISNTGTNALAGGGYLCKATDIITCKAGDTIKVQRRCSNANLQENVSSVYAYFTVRALT